MLVHLCYSQQNLCGVKLTKSQGSKAPIGDVGATGDTEVPRAHNMPDH